MPPAVSLLCALGLAAVHLLAGRLRFLEGIPRSRWLSLAGGASVAYVVVHLLPELAEGQEVFREATGGALERLEAPIYLVVLAGLTCFYGLERAALASRAEERPGARDASPAVFWLHVASFGLYNAVIGYFLLGRDGTGDLLVYVVAMGLHFVVNDFGLRAHHRGLYDRFGRWLLAAAVVAGWGLAYVTELPEVAPATLLAFLAGGVILNVLKEELPEHRRSRFWAFALGAVGYASLLLAL